MAGGPLGEDDMTIEGLECCPFCGKNEQVEHKQIYWLTRNELDYTYHIRCDYCGCLGPENSKSFKIAREEWNERKP